MLTKEQNYITKVINADADNFRNNNWSKSAKHEWIYNVKIKTESMQSKVVNRQTKTDSGRFCTILKNFTVNLFEHWGKCRLDVRWQLFSCLSCYLYSSGHAVFIKSWVNPVTMSLYTGSQWFEFCEYGVVRMLKQYLAFVFFGFSLDLNYWFHCWVHIVCCFW